MIVKNEVYENDKYQVTIKEAPYYSVNSTDNKRYDLYINAYKNHISNCYWCYEMEKDTEGGC